MIKKIAIIGGGIAGLVAAIGLKRLGFEVTVFEKAKQFLPLGSDIGLWPNALRILDKYGLYQKVLSQSGYYSMISLGTEEGKLISKTPTNEFHQIAPYNPINISRYELQDILVEALGKNEIIFNKTCIKIEETSKQVITHFQDGSTFYADLLVGADGAFSFVRDYIETDNKLNYAGYLSLGGISQIPYHIKYNLIFGKYLSGCFPIGNDRHIFFFVCKHSDFEVNKKYQTLSDQFNLFRNHTPLLDEMLDNLEQSIEKNRGLQNYFFVKNYNLQPLKKWIKGRTVLIGEAAHLVGPILGCSTSITLDGVDVLIQYLNQHRNQYKFALEGYEKVHKPRSRKLLALERKFTDKLRNNLLLSYASFNEDLISCLKG
ncbi:MAG: FAD-dependent monooxygenase [Tatlockia sp.]|nr:FAD-dependent monooxygenase [Tatlockia sp.]